jgi:hypothetical protein
MTVELDHVFICTAVGAPEADRLIDFGLSEGSPNHHPGQGTACRRFFFKNAYLELLWVVDPGEAQSALVRRTGLWERWARRGRDASPFGVGLRPISSEEAVAPFQAWAYRPPYLPEPLAIHMADNSEVLTEPLLFYLPFGRPPNPDDPARRQPREHAAGVRTITRLLILAGQGDGTAPQLRAVEEQCEGVGFAHGSEALMEVGFDGERSGGTADFRPALPLILRW